jgi:polyisoprenoid-binding protein YceI
MLKGDVVCTPDIATTRWRIDPARSSVEFRAKIWGLPAVKGHFSRYRGTLDLSGQPAIELTIETESLDTNHKKRDAHLRSLDFFGAEEHPYVRFVSESAIADHHHLGMTWNKLGMLRTPSQLTLKGRLVQDAA